MAKFKFKADERGENKDGLEETAEEHAARVKENQSRRSRGEFTEDETKELEAAAEAHRKQQEMNERAKAAREELGLYTGAEKREMIEAQRKQQAEERRDRLERVRSGFSYGSNTEEERREREHERDMAAHDRADERKFRTALRDPGRYAPSVLKAAQEWRDNNIAQKRFDAEMEMRGKESDNKRIGMVDQGKGKAEVDAAKELEIAKMNDATQRELGRAQHGYFDEQGTYHPGSTVAGQEAAAKAMAEKAIIGRETAYGVQERKNEGAVAKQTEANKGAAAKAQIQAQMQEKKDQAAWERNQANLQGRMDETKFKERRKTFREAMKPNPVTGKRPTLEEVKKLAQSAEEVAMIEEQYEEETGEGGGSERYRD